MIEREITMIVQRRFLCTILFAAFLLVGLFAPQPVHAA